MRRTALEALGDDLCLGYPTADERQIVAAAIFGDQRQAVAECVGRMRRSRPESERPEDLLRGIADPHGDPLARAANFALAFDPLRIDLLRVFARLGRGILGHPGPVALESTMSDDLEAAAGSAREHARRLATCPSPPGLDRISRLAREVAEGRTAADTVRSTVRFHHDEGRSWIVPASPDRYSVGRSGQFEDPAPAFNGYTVGRAFQLLADTREGA